MADTSIKPVSKCQSCIEISTFAESEDPKVVKYCKSRSVTELGSFKVTSTAATSVNVHLPGNKEAEGEAVLCDFCLEEKVKAVKTCLTCMVNYCTTHLRPHLDNPKLHSHQLVSPLSDTDLRTCALHNKPLELFCKLDLLCICEECAEWEHKDHQPISCAEAKKQVEVCGTTSYGQSINMYLWVEFILQNCTKFYWALKFSRELRGIFI